MKNNVILLEEYKRNLINKKNLDNGTVSLEDLSFEELDGIIDLYISEIRNINNNKIWNFGKKEKIILLYLECFKNFFYQENCLEI